MKSSFFRKVNFTIERNGYGQYTVKANYRGRAIEAHCTDSLVYDWLDDEESQENRNRARRICYELIKNNF